MRHRRLGRRTWLFGAAALLVMLALFVAGLSLAGGSGGEAPASRDALQRIAAKNREAAIVSAARLKTESDAAAAAADARIAREAEADPAEPSR